MKKPRKARKPITATAMKKTALEEGPLPTYPIDEETQTQWSHAEVLRDLINAKVPPSEDPRSESDMGRLAANFDFWLESMDEVPPRKNRLRDAMNRFYSELPELQRREILNGWKPDPERWTRHDCDRMIGDAYRFLMIDTAGNKTQHQHRYIVFDNYRPVTVLIHEGTTQRQALDHLYKMIEAIVTQWPAMIDQEA